MTERGSKFCQKLWHDLGLYVDDLRGKGTSERKIVRRLEQLEACGISCEGWRKRIEHMDTCTHLQVKPTELTQAETRKYRKVSGRDQKRILQSFKDLQKNGKKAKKSTRALFKEAIRKVDPIVLRAGKHVVPKTTSKTSSPSPTSSGLQPNSLGIHTPLENAGIIPQTLGEKPLTRVTKDKHGISSETVDPSRMYVNSQCKCRECKVEEEDCLALTLYRERMQKVYAQ